MKLLSMETARLLAVVTAKRVGDLHALSGSAECMRFDDDGLKVVVKTNQAPGKPVSKIRLSQWVVEAIELAYSSRGLVPPVGMRAHSTRAMAASWALCRGVSI